MRLRRRHPFTSRLRVHAPITVACILLALSHLQKDGESPHSQHLPEGVTQLLNYLEGCTKRSNHPGGVLAVSWGEGQRLFTEFGVPHEETEGRRWDVLGPQDDKRTIEEFLPTGPCGDWIFPIGHLVEPMLVLTTLALVESKQLSLSDPVSRYIPEFAGPQVFLGLDATTGDVLTRSANREILVEDLVNHRSGIPLLSHADWNQFGPGGLSQGLHRVLADVPHRAASESLGEFARRLATLPLRVDPGASRALGEGHEVLGAILEQVTGRPLPEILAAYIFDPLGMDDTGFNVPLAKRSRKMPRMLYLPLPVACPPPTIFAFPKLEPLGDRSPTHSARRGVYSTAKDLLVFAELLAGEGQRAGVCIVSAEGFKMGFALLIDGVPLKRAPAPNDKKWINGMRYDPDWRMGGTGAGFFARSSPTMAGVILWRIKIDGNCSQKLGSQVADAMRSGN